MRKATYKEISKALLKVFNRRRSLNSTSKKKLDLNKDISYTYTDYRDFEAKGETLDVWGDFVVPGSDELHVRLFYNYTDHKLYLVTSITEYFFWFIPFTYAEYVIKLPEDKIKDSYDYFCNFTAQQAVPFIATADKWNINHKMERIETDNVQFFKSNGSNGIYYKCSSNDYSHLNCIELP